MLSAGTPWARWAGATAPAACGAWLVHAVGRPEGHVPLMALTVLYQIGAASWVGGVIQLAALWRLARHDADVDPLTHGLWRC